MHATYRPIKTRFRFAYTYRLKLAAYIKSLTHYTKGTPSGLNDPSTACRHPVSGSLSLPLSGCFSPFPHGTCSLSVNQQYLALESGLPIFRQDFSCPALLKNYVLSTCTGLSPSTACLPRQFQFFPLCRSAGPISLAATFGVSVDFLSCRYLDVSVPCVRFSYLCIQQMMTINGRVSPFRYPRINTYSQLPAAFRSVSRLSSPLIAKASTKCPYLSLDSYNINILLFISHSTKNLTRSLFRKTFFGVYFYTCLPRFFDNIICFISYYSAFSLFTMSYSILKEDFFWWR